MRLLDLFPIVDHGSMILTTQTGYAISQLFLLPNLEVVHSVHLTIAKRYLEARLAAKEGDDVVLQLAQEMEGIPKALALAANCIRDTKIDPGDYLELFRKRKAIDLISDPVSVTMELGQRVLPTRWSVVTQLANANRTIEDGTYGSGRSEQQDNEKLNVSSEIRSGMAISSFVDIGLGGWLRGIEVFASDLVQCLSPDIPNVVGDSDMVTAAVQDALRVYSYSLEQQEQPEKLSDEQKAAHFVRQQSR